MTEYRIGSREFVSVTSHSYFTVDIGAVGTMMCAYLVPFHITHGPPLVQSVGSASSCLLSGVSTMMCAGLTTQLFVAVFAVANGSVLLAPWSPRSM